MVYGDVILELKASNFPETGIPFKLNKVLKYTKDNKQYKKDWEEFVEHCRSIKNVSDIDDFYSNSLDTTTIEMQVFNGKPKTFKFLGMDVTEDLDVVIQGSYGTIFVGELYNPDIVSRILKNVQRIDEAKIDRIITGINKDTLLVAIENLKLGSMVNAPDKMSGFDSSAFSDDVKHFDFLKPVIDDVLNLGGMTYSSIVMNLVNTKISTGDVPTEKEVLNAIYTGICTNWNTLIHRYYLVSRVISAYSMFLDLYGKLFGKDTTRKIVNQSSKPAGLIGCLEGYAKDSSIEGRTLSCTVAKDLIGSVMILNVAGNSTMKYPIETYMTTMFDFSNKVDITTMDKKTALAYSVLDGLKYTDEDLNLVSQNYDMNDPEEREVFLKNVITGYKKKFENFNNDRGISIDDNIINAVIPVDNTSIDILNVAKSTDPNEVIDVEVSRVSFNKTNLLNACKLIARLTNILNAEFKVSKI